MHDHTNALINEASPYLLQHAHNPVDWVPWSEAAFQQANAEDKVVFLSIGYAACHWCHVMAHESFENDSIAAYLNKHFICIKVDREERPDLDHHYMQAVQKISGSGGWPMSVFLTPDKKPFFGGTYWPPQSRYGRPGFLDVLRSVQEHWESNRKELIGSAEQVHSLLEQNSRISEQPDEISPALFETMTVQSAAHYDKTYGGFGPAPKFPHAMELSMLLREYARTDDKQARDMVEHTLDKMSRGGICDHLGGGFARYSTDARWLVPHFEKMLYDNALLIPLLLDASLAFNRLDFRETAVKCLEWVLREMEMPEGGFASSLDADSEGEEGKFYVWTPEELNQILGTERGTRFAKVYDVTPQGNFENGKSILNLKESVDEWARKLEIDSSILALELNEDRRLLLDERVKRVRPGRDDKVLTDWNGLFLSALLKGYAVTGDERYLTAAERTANRLLTPFEKHGRLVHSFLGERRQETQLLLDYAAFGNGLLDLFFATGDNRWFKGAVQLANRLHELFANPGGLYYLSTDAVAGIRSTDPFDSAMPAGTSLAGILMAKLYYVIGEDRFRQRAEAQVAPIAGYLKQHAPAFAQGMFTAEMLVYPPSQLVLVGDESRKFWKAANERYLPGTQIIWVEDETDSSSLSSLLDGKTAIDGKATAYLCRDFKCEFPVTTVEELQEKLE